MLTLYELLVLVMFARTSFAQVGFCMGGSYGDNCELTCSKTCRPFQTFPCDKNTGQCSEGCQGGYYGDQCDKRCSCASGVCYQQNGKCLEISATTDRTTQNTTTIRNGSTKGPAVYVCEGVPTVWRVIGITFLAFTVFLFLTVIGMLLFKTVRQRTKHSSHTGANNRRFHNFPRWPGRSGKETEITGQDEHETVELRRQAPQDEQAEHTGQAPQAEQTAKAATDQAPSKDQQSDRHVTETFYFAFPLMFCVLALPGMISSRRSSAPQWRMTSATLASKKDNSNRSVKKKRNNEEKEKLSQRIKELEEEKHQMDERHTNEKRQIEEKHEEEKCVLEEKYFAEINQTLCDLGFPTNSTIHQMKSNKLDPSIWLQCPNLKFDKEAVNLKVAHVSENMTLINSPDPSPYRNKGKQEQRRFKTFQGTTCTNPLEKTGFYKYFEAVFYITLYKAFKGGEILLQIGFCEEKDKDANTFTEGNKSCCVVEAVGCTNHTAICLVFTHGDKPVCIQQLDISKKVNIGFRLNKENKRLGVYDFGVPKELLKTNINIGDRIWPMFGVCDQDRASVKVKLRSGRDIKMSGEKKNIIKPKDKKY